MRQRSVILAVSFLIGLPLFLYIVAGLDVETLQTTVFDASSLHLVMYGLLTLFNIVVYTWIWTVFLRWQSVSLNLITLFNYRMVGVAISYVTPGPRVGGEVTQAGLLEPDVPFRKGFLTASLEKIVLFLAGLVFNTVTVVIALLVFPGSDALRLIVGGLLLACLVILGVWWWVVAQGRLIPLVKKVVSWAGLGVDERIEFSFKDFEAYLTGNTRRFFGLVAVGFATKIIIGFQLYFLTAGLGAQVTVWEALFLAAAIDIAYSIPAYMGVGFLEAGQSGAFALIGSSTTIGVLIALITRMRDLLFSLYGLFALGYYTFCRRS